MSEELTKQDVQDALERIARTEDGLLFLRYLQKIRYGLTTNDMSDGALRWNEGRRSLAGDLMALMAEGIRTSGRAGDSPVVTFAIPGARAVARTRGAGRRVTADTIVSGWSTDDTSPGPGSTNGSGES